MSKRRLLRRDKRRELPSSNKRGRTRKARKQEEKHLRPNKLDW